MTRFLLVLAIAGMAAAADPADPFRSYLEGLAQHRLEARRQEVSQLKTREEWDQRRAVMRQRFLEMIGGLPEERTPLNLRKTGTLDRGSYRVEKIIFESQPGFYVTGNLYVPQTGSGPYPAVLQPTGHSTTAKNRAFYQMLAIGLAKQGFVVLTYDPIGQGERRLFFDRDLEDSKVGSTTVEHTMVGIRCVLGGESMARTMIWDGMRAVDVLAAMPQVDRERIGVTGCSGGGTLTVYLAALDGRLKAAAPSCYVTSWEDQLKGTGPQDAEQQFPLQLANGFDHGDLVALAAPIPYLIGSTDQDFFPLEGARRTFEAARAVWKLYGAENKIGWFHEPGPHGVYKAGRESIYGWMRQWLRGEQPAPVSEPEIVPEYEEDLNCTSTGQVTTSLGGEGLSAQLARRFAGRVPQRPALRTDADLNALREQMRERVLKMTRFQPSTVRLDVQEEGEQFSFLSDEGLRVPATLKPSAGESQRARLAIYVSQKGGRSETRELEALSKLGYRVLAIDVSGTGALYSKWATYSESWFGQDKTTWLAVMLGHTVVGLEIRDILRAVEALHEKGLMPAEGLTGIGRGTAAIALLHAALIEPRITRLVLEDMPGSYRAIAAAPIHRRIFEGVVPGVLGQYDLPDLAAVVSPRPVTLVNTRTPSGARMFRKDVQEEYRYAAEAAKAAGGSFSIRLREEKAELVDAVPELR
ncbi:MAG: acetylxylan esterase [Bryobacteraceae bacterium]